MSAPEEKVAATTAVQKAVLALLEAAFPTLEGAVSEGYYSKKNSYLIEQDGNVRLQIWRRDLSYVEKPVVELVSLTLVGNCSIDPTGKLTLPVGFSISSQEKLVRDLVNANGANKVFMPERTFNQRDYRSMRL